MDLKLDAATGDFDLANGSIVLVDGNDAIAQHLRIRLRFFFAEWFLDTRLGIPYFQKILGQKRRKSVIDQIFRKVILNTPGVASIDSFSQNYDGATRELSIDFACVAEDGTVLVFDDLFIIS